MVRERRPWPTVYVNARLDSRCNPTQPVSHPTRTTLDETRAMIAAAPIFLLRRVSKVCHRNSPLRSPARPVSRRRFALRPAFAPFRRLNLSVASHLALVSLLRIFVELDRSEGREESEKRVARSIDLSFPTFLSVGTRHLVTFQSPFLPRSSKNESIARLNRTRSTQACT